MRNLSRGWSAENRRIGRRWTACLMLQCTSQAESGSRRVGSAGADAVVAGSGCAGWRSCSGGLPRAAALRRLRLARKASARRAARGGGGLVRWLVDMIAAVENG